METVTKQRKHQPRRRVLEALRGGTKIGEVALTHDRMTWIAGIVENDAIVHIGSFATLEEAKTSLERRWPDGKSAVAWRETHSYEMRD